MKKSVWFEIIPKEMWFKMIVSKGNLAYKHI